MVKHKSLNMVEFKVMIQGGEGANDLKSLEQSYTSTVNMSQ